MDSNKTILLSKPIRRKLIEAVNYGYKNCYEHYSENLYKAEFIIILALFYTFLTKDIALYYILQDVLAKTDDMEYSHLFWWSWKEFKFTNSEKMNVISFANYLAQTGQLKLPQQVLAIFIDLERTYGTICLGNRERQVDYNKKLWPQNQGIVKHLIRPIHAKIEESVMFAFKHKINKKSLDFNSKQTLLLTLFYSLLTRDVAICITLQEIISAFVLRIDYSCTYYWLKCTFKFDKQDVMDVVSFASCLTDKRVLNLPVHLMIFRDLSEMYSNEDLFSPKEAMFGNLRELTLDPFNFKEKMAIHELYSSSKQYNILEKKRINLGKTPLHVAASLGDASAVHFMGLHCGHLNTQDCNGRTPLHEAVKGLHFETVRVLLELGASSEIRDSENMTPIGLAQLKKSKAMLKLFDNYPNSSAKGLLSSVPDHWGIDKKYINKRDSEGRSLLHMAAGLGMTEEVARLLDLGAEFNLRDKMGRTPLEHAYESRNYETIYLLKKASKILNQK